MHRGFISTQQPDIDNNYLSPISTLTDMKYWLMIDGTRRGPFTVEQVAMQPGVDADTPVWYNGMPDWTVVADVPELACIISGPKVPQPPAYQPVLPTPSVFPQEIQQPVPSQPCPPNYLVWAIIATVLCCTPLGIVAIVYSAGVSSAYHSGDLETAMRRSRKARLWTIVAAVAGVLFTIFYTIYALSSGDFNPSGYNYDF